MKILKTFIFAAAVLAAYSSFGQSLQAYPENNVFYNQAVDLYNKEMYKSALEKFDKAAETMQPEALQTGQIDFYHAMCAMYTGSNNAGMLSENVLNRIPANQHYDEAAFGYGKLLYDNQDFNKASEWFSKADPKNIPQARQAEYYFLSGYCFYRAGKTDQAVANFRRIKDQDNLYSDHAVYYYSHIEYERGNNLTASSGFERLRSNPVYASIIPFYTLQIAFLQKDYDKVIREGEEFLNRPSDDRQNEIVCLLAEAYMNKGEYNKAKDYFAKYESQSGGILTREDKFLKAYILYKSQDYASAGKIFESSAGSVSDISAQRSYYYAGDCYVKTGDKTSALNAFMQASRYDFDPAIQEDAHFNYAKLALDIQNNDKPVNDYFTKYPAGKNSDELSVYMASVDAQRGNYDRAVETLSSIKNPGYVEREAIRRVAFASGLDMMKNKRYGSAVAMFDLSIQNTEFNNSIRALATYWKAEAAYQSEDYESALSQYRNFVNTAGSFNNMREYKIAHYNIGYCYFKKREYDEALLWFRKYISFEDDSRKKSVYLGDCYNRIGDCYFKKRLYDEAFRNYGTAEALGLSDPDYSAMQRAISLGFTSSDDAKLKALQNFPRAHPRSKYLPAVYYETGRTLQQMMKYDDAVTNFRKIPSSSPYYPKALTELGLIELNKGNADKALSYYQQVAEKYPGSDEAANAMQGIRDIYISQNKPDEYFAYSNRLGRTVSNPGERDLLVFTAAEKQYQSGDCDKALPAMKKYLTDFPTGKHLTEANFYIADCETKKGSYRDAAAGYLFVTRQPANEFTEAAWSGYAAANYNMKNFGEAAKAFETLKLLSAVASRQIEAETGCMRSYVALNDYGKAAAAAARVAATQGISADLAAEAGLIRGKNLFLSNDYDGAVNMLKPLAKDLNKPVDAEAKYFIIASQYSLKKYDEAENNVYEFAESKSRQQYWVAKSFIVLGDIYVQRRNYAQAKATYKSVLDGYTNKTDGIIDEAQRQYNAIERN